MSENQSCYLRAIESSDERSAVLRGQGPELVQLTERVTGLAARAGCVLSEQARLERRYAGVDGPAGIVVLRGSRAVGYAHLIGGADPAPGWDVEIVGDPAQPEAFPSVLSAVLAEARRAGVPTVRWWPPPSAAAGLLARSFQLERDHVLYRLEAPLTTGPAAAGSLPAGFSVRPLSVPFELEPWLALNRRTFAGHPTQRRWTGADLAHRIVQPWFDPQGFLVAEAEGRLVATCWAKLAGEAPGELYVVAVDPSYQGNGLGRAVAAAGLRHLAARGARGAFLHVADDNDAALRLYAGLGFTPAGVQNVWRARTTTSTASQPTKPVATIAELGGRVGQT